MTSETLSENIFEISSGYSGERFQLSPGLEEELSDDNQPELLKQITTVETAFNDRAFISIVPTVLPVRIFPSIRTIMTQEWTDVRFFLEYTSFDKSQVQEMKYKYVEGIKKEIANQIGTYALLTVATPLSQPTPTGYSVLDQNPESLTASLLNRHPMLYASVDHKGHRTLLADSLRKDPYDDEIVHRYLDKPEPEEGLEPGNLTLKLDSDTLPSETWKQIEIFYEEFQLKATRTLISS